MQSGSLPMDTDMVHSLMSHPLLFPEGICTPSGAFLVSTELLFVCISLALAGGTLQCLASVY